MLRLGLPVGCEFLDPITPQYIADTVAWGAIGARTVESQVHRQLASGLSMPIGMKNRPDGSIGTAVDAIRAAGVPHVFPGIDFSGTPAIMHTRGNADGHLVLRGGGGRPNYDAESVAGALDLLRAAGLPERVVIDASHANSGKDHRNQPRVAADVAAQLAAGQRGIVGVMLESFLLPGRQDLDPTRELEYGQSVTDACLGWEDHRRGARPTWPPPSGRGGPRCPPPPDGRRRRDRGVAADTARAGTARGVGPLSEVSVCPVSPGLSLNCLRGIPSGWSRVVPLAERRPAHRTHSGAPAFGPGAPLFRAHAKDAPAPGGRPHRRRRLTDSGPGS